VVAPKQKPKNQQNKHLTDTKRRCTKSLNITKQTPTQSSRNRIAATTSEKRCENLETTICHRTAGKPEAKQKIYHIV